MEIVRGFSDVAIPKVIIPTRDALYPLLEAHKSDIESVPRKTFQFGETERHKLDVYYPKIDSSVKAPILLLAYGGGFNSGERVFDPPYDLAHRNIGAFYAKRGILTVITDYRLVPNVTYPAQAEDVKDALIWVINNAENMTQGFDIEVDTRRVFLIGHSAGGAHVATIFLAPGLLPSEYWSHVKGIILMGAAVRIGPKEDLAPTISQYYGSEEEMRAREPIALLRQASQETMDSLPKVLMLKSEKEPKAIWEGNTAFLKVLNEKLPSPVEEIIMEGHNHISPVYALSGGEGELFGERIAQWIKDTE